jgi:glycosyltransferase involved in cell wall biosynthesis
MKARLQQIAVGLRLAARVHFSPPLTAKAKWEAYIDADVFVLPSLNENFGNTAAESVVAGTPVIVTENCGIAPLLDEVAGLVVRHDETDLRNAMARILNDQELYEKLRKGCAVAVDNLGWEQPLEQMQSLYSSLAAPAHP